MKYFLDTEFIEGKQSKTFLGFKYGETKPTIDLISIGIVCEDGREYYAISKDFNLKEAWNRFQLSQIYGDARNIYPNGIKVHWIRENILKPIWEELLNKSNSKRYDYDGNCPDDYFSYNSLKYLINKYGKTNKQIAKEIKEFTNKEYHKHADTTIQLVSKDNPEFYGYYADYDWVVFCWLFGNMINLPKGFPMYCVDLKQQYDLIYSKTDLKEDKDYPKQINEHNALADAKWNYELYKFLTKIN